MSVTLSNKVTTVEVEETSARIVSLLGPSGYNWLATQGCFVMLPWVSRIRDGKFRFAAKAVSLPPNNNGDPHPIHGHGWQGAWQTVKQTESELRLAMDYPGREWPWPYRAEVSFALANTLQSALQIVVTIENKGAETMPVGMGIHPYFSCRAGTTLSMNVAEQIVLDSELMYQSVAPFVEHFDGPILKAIDSVYSGWDRIAVLQDERGESLLITADERFTNVIVYGDPAQEFLCIEPVNHVPNALNHPELNRAYGMDVLEPQMKLSGSVRLSIS